MKSRRLAQLLSEGRPVLAPGVFDPLSASLARAAGFEALYLGGGGLGYLKCLCEANLDLHDVANAGLDIMGTCDLPLIMDAACGYGDPMHVVRTVRMAEQVGFAAIEIEDQVLPKRVGHHVGHEHVIPAELMVAKIEEAVNARRDPDFLIIGRTSAVRSEGLDQGLRRAEALRAAGADILFLVPRDLEEARAIAERLGGPLMFPAMEGFSTQSLGASIEELYGWGYHLIVDGGMALYAAHAAMRGAYEAMANKTADPLLGPNVKAELSALQKSAGLNRLLEIEKRTIKD